MSVRFRIFTLATAFLLLACFAPLARADDLSIVYTSSQTQTATVGPGFTSVDFAGYIVNNTDAPITFQLTGGPEPFAAYVAGFIDGIPYPGITLASGASTSIFDLFTVNLNPFDPSLTYPGTVNIVLDAISVDPTTGQTGGVITENDASILVQAPVPEPSTLALLLPALLLIAFLCHRQFPRLHQRGIGS